MEQHVKIVAILNIVLGALGALAAVIILLIFGGAAGIIGSQAGAGASGREAEMAAPIVALVGGVIFFIVLIISLPCLIAGVGLLNFREWARILTIVLSVLNLVNFPFGTALGIYGLWVLMNAETTALFKAKNAG